MPAHKPERRNPPARAGFDNACALGQALPNRTRTSALMSIGSSIELLLHRLQGVRQRGSGWVARCPAHEDRTPSLAICVGGNGNVLLRCFAGCSVFEIVSVIGMNVGDLFPKSATDLAPEQQRDLRRLAAEANWSAALGVLDREATVVLIAASDLARNSSLPAIDHARLVAAIDRIASARLVLTGGRHG